MAKAHAAPRRHRATRARGGDETATTNWIADARVLAMFALLGAVLVAAAVLLLRQVGADPGSTAPQAAAPTGQAAVQTDWKSKGAAGAAVVIEEWGDFQ